MTWSTGLAGQSGMAYGAGLAKEKDRKSIRPSEPDLEGQLRSEAVGKTSDLVSFCFGNRQDKKFNVTTVIHIPKNYGHVNCLTL